MKSTENVLMEIEEVRIGQINKGFSHDHDDMLSDCSLELLARRILDQDDCEDKFNWTFGRAMHIATKHSRRSRLIIAAAMLVAEIERIDREESTIALSLTPTHPDELPDYQPGDELPK